MKDILQTILSGAGITINGDNPWDMQVHNSELYRRILAQGSLGLGESYMDGWWDCRKLDCFFCRLLSSSISEQAVPLISKLYILKSKLFNLQSRGKSMEVINRQYELGNDLFKSFLDPYHQYTCAYYHDTEDLNTAQEKKLELICKKLQLTASDHVLDIGCGWGGFARFAAEKYHCRVTGITLSDSQVQLAEESCAGLPVRIKKLNYRNLTGEKKYDKILVCGMIEHVGYKNYPTFMDIVHRQLKDSGLFLLHTIGRNTSTTYGDPWTVKYIFRNAMLPSGKQLFHATEGKFILADWHTFGEYYDTTLMAWQKNFTQNWQTIQPQYDERFYRMWNYYLLCSAGAFRANDIQLWQILFAKKERGGNYHTVR